MARLYGFFKWLWGFLGTVVIAGPLGNWVYDLYKDPTAVPGKVIVDFLQTYWQWELGAFCVTGALTVWSWQAYREQRSREENERQRREREHLQGSAIPAQQTTVSVRNSRAGRDTIATTGPVHTGDDIEVVQGDYVKGNKITYQAPVSAPRSLHQLASPPRDFTGRAAELSQILQAVERGGVTISGIQGMGGVGKTALALKLAEHLTPRYPDAQFYLDLEGTSAQPLSVAEVMTYVIQGYHSTAPLPKTEAALTGQYRSVLHAQRALLLFDNAASKEQIAPLIPPPTCLLVQVPVNKGWKIETGIAQQPETTPQYMPPHDRNSIPLQWGLVLSGYLPSPFHDVWAVAAAAGHLARC